MARLKQAGPRVRVASRRIELPAKTVDPLYVSPEWRVFASAIKRQRDYTCEVCGQRDRSVHADHVVEVKDGGATFDPLNIKLRCHACHNSKTARERARRLSVG